MTPQREQGFVYAVGQRSRRLILRSVRCALWRASPQSRFDVFNALDLMQNAAFLKELLFGGGDGYLHYYLYNYRMPDMKAEDVGLVLL